MDCDECAEQILELIEREAVDPEGVREILARCPDCRVAFEETKAALAMVADLPLDEPPDAIDAAILRAAAERVPEVVDLPKRRLQPPPWAMAAIALLAVGVGVWAIPRGVPLESDQVPTKMDKAEEVITAAQVLDEEPEPEDVVVQAKSASESEPHGSNADDAAKATKAPAQPVPTKRRSRSRRDEPTAALMTEAPASGRAAESAAGAAPNSASEKRFMASAEREQARDEDDEAAACKRKVEQMERRRRDEVSYVPGPEEELAIGKCYQMLANVDEAKKWLLRAAEHLETKARAEEALRKLAGE